MRELDKMNKEKPLPLNITLFGLGGSIASIGSSWKSRISRKIHNLQAKNRMRKNEIAVLEDAVMELKDQLVTAHLMHKAEMDSLEERIEEMEIAIAVICKCSNL